MFDGIGKMEPPNYRERQDCGKCFQVGLSPNGFYCAKYQKDVRGTHICDDFVSSLWSLATKGGNYYETEVFRMCMQKKG